MLNSGATNNVREAKKKEDFKGAIPIEFEVAFGGEVKAELYINPEGTIIGPEGTETIVSMNELVKVGYQVPWKKGQLVIKMNKCCQLKSEVELLYCPMKYV